MTMRDAHIGVQVPDLDAAMTLLSDTLGITFAEPVTSTVRVRVGEQVEETTGRFTVSRQGPPFMEVTEDVAGSKVWTSDGSPVSFHHLGFWVDDVPAAAARLAQAGYPAEASGLNDADGVRYSYHRLGSLRVEVCAADARAEFERWATTGQAGGAVAAFERSGSHDEVAR